ARQQPPDVPGMVADPGHLLDDRRDAGEGPVVGVEPVHVGALPERLLEVMELLVGQAAGAPVGAGAAQCVLPAGAPAGVPAADVLPGDAELVSDLGLGAAGGKECAGLQTDAFERLAVTKTTGVAAVGGWSHAAMLPRQPPDQQVKPANSYRRSVCLRVVANRRVRDTDQDQRGAFKAMPPARSSCPVNDDSRDATL